MSPEATALLLAALAAGTGALLVAGLLLASQLARTLDRLAPALARAEAIGLEQARRLAAIDALEDTQRLAESAVDTGTSIVREVHQGIASIPFGILEALPGTRAPAKAVRSVHDAISDGVYDALSGLNRAVGRELRRGLKRSPQGQNDEAEPSAPDSPPPGRD